MIKVAISGLGNLGKYAIEAIESAPDMECIAVLRRKESLGTKPLDLRAVPDFDSIENAEAAVGKADVIIICEPSRSVPDTAAKYLAKGYHTVDSYDVHTGIVDLLDRLQPIAEKAGKAAIVSAGWDPGTDSALRAYFEAMAPIGATFTNFGRGRSMGHSVVARGIKGVKDAVSITIPIGGGAHSRLVYVELEQGESLATVKERIQADDYFSHDPLHVVEVDSVDAVADSSHGVLLERVGGFGSVSNQNLKFDMRINNPALTAQVLVSCARAAAKMPAGAHTLIDIPPVYLLAGERKALIKRLV
ncbi:MAG: diaminopimelate dehydrogenase [Deferribacteraceae bacterium]|nr:diaminopimelate dehydrogenase [Deferribacteraceae bacterium]